MFAKLVLLAEQISFDELGRISAEKLLLDTFHELPCRPSQGRPADDVVAGHGRRQPAEV